MINKIILYLSQIQLLLIITLITNHMSRGLNWLPLSILIFPSIALVITTYNYIKRGKK